MTGISPIIANTDGHHLLCILQLFSIELGIVLNIARHVERRRAIQVDIVQVNWKGILGKKEI